MLITQDEL